MKTYQRWRRSVHTADAAAVGNDEAALRTTMIMKTTMMTTTGVATQTDVDVVAAEAGAYIAAAAAAAEQHDGPLHRHTGDGDDNEPASGYSNEAAAAVVNCEPTAMANVVVHLQHY